MWPISSKNKNNRTSQNRDKHNFLDVFSGWRSLKTLVVDPDLCVPYGFPVKDKVSRKYLWHILLLMLSMTYIKIDICCLPVQLDRSSSRAALALNDMTEDKEEVNAITNGRVHSRLPESPRQRNRSYSAPSIGQDISLKSVESFGSLYYTNMEMFNYSGLVWFNKDDMVTRLWRRVMAVSCETLMPLKLPSLHSDTTCKCCYYM